MWWTSNYQDSRCVGVCTHTCTHTHTYAAFGDLSGGLLFSCQLWLCMWSEDLSPPLLSQLQKVMVPLPGEPQTTQDELLLVPCPQLSSFQRDFLMERLSSRQPPQTGVEDFCLSRKHTTHLASVVKTSTILSKAALLKAIFIWDQKAKPLWWRRP